MTAAARTSRDPAPDRSSAGRPHLPALVRRVLCSPGQPLAGPERAQLEPQFGHRLDHVRLHTDATAARSADLVRARAYTVGHDVVWAAGEYRPARPDGRRLLAHELAHVDQQSRAGSTDPGGRSPETGAERAAAALDTGGQLPTAGGTRVGLARTPRSVDQKLDPTGLTHTELEEEIEEIQQHLDANPFSSPENDHLAQEQEAMRKELARRGAQERGRRRRPARTPAQRPRSLDQSLLVDASMPDQELYTEIDAIHAALRAGASKQDKVTLRSALSELETERGRRKGVAAATARSERIIQAFAPRVTATDGEALADVMGTIESIRPSSSTPGHYVLIRDGELITITAEEHDRIRTQAQRILRARLIRISGRADGAELRYASQREINEKQFIVSGVVHFFGGVDDPGPAVAQNVALARYNASAVRAAVENGQLTLAATFFAASERYATVADRLAAAYVNELISTADTTVTVLEVTRDAAFAATLAIGAVVAAPVVAAGAAGFGLTGAGATVATVAGTGLVVGAEGAVLRGGSAAGGTALAGGSRAEVLEAATSEGSRGFKEGLATGVGGSVAQRAGVLLKVGQSTSGLVNLGRGAVAQGLGNAAGSATATAAEGKGPGDIARSAAISFGIGFGTGPLSTGAGAIKNPLLAAAARTGLGAGVSGAQTYVETGDREAAFRAAAVGAASAYLGGLGQPAAGPTRGQQLARQAGQAGRARLRAAARTVRNVTASAALGIAEAVPATHGTGASIGITDPSRPTARPLTGATAVRTAAPPTPAPADPAVQPTPTPAEPAPAVRPQPSLDPAPSSPRPRPLEEFLARGGQIQKLPPGPAPEASVTAAPTRPRDQLSRLGESPEVAAIHETTPGRAGVRRPRTQPERGQQRPELPSGVDAAHEPIFGFREPFADPVAAQLQKEILKLAETNPQEAGRRYETLVAGDIQGGTDVQNAFRRPGRRMDIGTEHEVTIEGVTSGFSSTKLDQLWDDLVDKGNATLTVPRLSPQARSQLERLAAQARTEIGPRTIIVVRETLP